MTVKTTIDPAVWLRNRLDDPDGESDLLAEMLKAFAETLMSAEASARCGAEYGERTDERVNSRNGYRERRWDTRAGTIELAVQKLRQGTYFPEWLLPHRRRSEQALVTVIAQAYVSEFRDRRLNSGPYRYVCIDALTQKVREGGRVVNVSAVGATAVNVEGPPGDHRVRCRHVRDDGRLDDIPAFPCRTGPVGC